MTELVGDPLDRLYAYAAWMLGDRNQALALLRAAVRAQPAEPGRFAALRKASVQLEILPLLPLGHFELEAVDLSLLDLEIVVDEAVAEA